MDIQSFKDNKNVKSLIEMASLGHFPIFENEWIQEISMDEKNLNFKEKTKAKQLFEKVVKHRTFARQKTVLFCMDRSDRKILIKSFLKMVEGHILDKDIELH